MSGFSLGDAFASGFRLIGRRPGAILAWAVVFFVLGLLPTFLVFALAAPDLFQLFQQAMTDAARAAGERSQPDLAQLFELQSKLLGVRAVGFLANIVARVGRPLSFDPQREQITGDEEANRLVRRQYREGHWAVPKGSR